MSANCDAVYRKVVDLATSLRYSQHSIHYGPRVIMVRVRCLPFMDKDDAGHLTIMRITPDPEVDDRTREVMPLKHSHSRIAT